MPVSIPGSPLEREASARLRVPLPDVRSHRDELRAAIAAAQPVGPSAFPWGALAQHQQPAASNAKHVDQLHESIFMETPSTANLENTVPNPRPLMNFDACFERLVGHEGGYVNHPKDPGGETKYGISKRSYPAEDIANLTLARAKEIYQRDYWNPAGCNVLPEALKFDVFDMAVNSGVRQAVKTLQRAVGAKEDGLLGSITLAAAQDMKPDRVLMRFNAARLLFMTGLAGWSAFGKGWARRVAENQLSA